MKRTFRWRRGLCLSLLVTAGLAVPRSAQASDPDPDPWLGRDKALHFGASALIAGGTYGIVATQADARWPRLLVGGGVSLAVGAAKEGADALGLGDPSWKDFTWDVIGTVAGLAIAWAIDVAVRGVGPAHPAFGDP